MELSVGASTSQLQELQVYSSRKTRLACIKVCEKFFVSFLSMFNDSRKPAPVSQLPTQDTGLVSLPLKEPKTLNLPNQFNEPNVTPFTYPEGRQCPNGSQSNNQQNAPSSGGQSNVPTNYPNQSNESRGGPPGGPSNNPSQSDDPREPGSGSDPPDPDPDSDPDPDPDEPDSDCPIGEPNCPICFYFEQRKIAIFGSKDGGRKSPNMELLFNEPIFTSQYQSSLPNISALGSTSQQQQFATSGSPFNVPTPSVSSSQPIRTNVSREQDPSSRSLLPNVRVVLPQSGERQSSSLNPEFKVPEAPAYQPKPHSSPRINVPIVRPSATVSISPFRQQQLIESGSPSNVPTVQTFNPQTQQAVYGSQLYRQTSSSPIPTPPSESRSTSLKSPLRVPKFTPSQPQSLGTPLQQLEYLVTGGPRASRFSSQVEQVVHANEPSSPGSVQNVRPQSEPPRSILLEPLLRVPSVTPSRLQSMGTTAPDIGSQHLIRSRRSSLDVPRVLGFSPQLQQPVRSHEPESHERRSLLKRSLTDVPNVRNILPQPSLSRDIPFQVPEVPVYEPEIKRRRTDPSPQFNVSRVRPSQLQSNITSMPAFGSALQQQQYFTSAGRSRVPTVEIIHSQLRQPVRASVSQLYERSPLRRASISIPHTVTMPPRSNVPTSYESVLRVPNVLRSQSRSSITNVPGFGSALQQQQPLSFGSQLNIPTAQSFRPRVQQQHVRMYGSQPYQESHSLVGSLNLPTSQPLRITSTLGSPLEQLEVLASKGPELSDFNSQVQQLVSDPELYDRSSSVAGSLTDVSSMRHVLPQFETPRETSIEPRPIIPPQFRPASQQEPLLRFMGPLDVPTPPVYISKSQQTVRAKPIQRKRSSTGSLINVPSVRAVLPHSRESKSPSEREPKKKDPFSIASLLDLPEAQTDLPQSEEPINPSFEQQSDVPIVPPSQSIIRRPIPQSNVSSVRLSQLQSKTTDLPAFSFPLQQQQLVTLGGQSRVPEREALGPQLQQPIHVYGSRLYQQRPWFDVPKVLSQSSEPQIRVPSIIPSRPQSSITSMPAFGSALQQQYLASGSRLNIPTARATQSQLQQPVRAFVPQSYERPSLRRGSISIPHTLTTLPRSSEPRDPSLEPPLNVPTVRLSEPQSSVAVFGSALQQQQYRTFGGQSRVPIARPYHSHLQQPVRASVSQLYQRPSLRRSLINLPHTLTMPPRSNEPRHPSFEPPVMAPRTAFPRPQSNITNVPGFGSALQQQRSLAFGAQSNLPTRQALIPQLEQSIRTRGFRDVLPPSNDPALVSHRFGAPETIPSQPPPQHPNLPFGSLSQQQSLLPFGGLSSVPEAQYISQSFQQIPSLVGPNVPPILPSLEPKIIVPKVPAYRPQLNKPIALSLPYLDLPKVSTIGPQLRPHGESAFRAVTLPPRTDTISDVGNLRGAGLPELRRTDLGFADLVYTPRRL